MENKRGKHGKWTALLAICLSVILAFSLTGCGSTKTKTVDAATLQDTLLSADSSLPDICRRQQRRKACAVKKSCANAVKETYTSMIRG